MTECFLIRSQPSPKVAIVYTAVPSKIECESFAQHFVDSYRQYPSGVDHSVTVVCNGGQLQPRVKSMLTNEGFSIHVRNNAGWDIGGYIEMARKTDPDLLVCFGESVYFHRSGWLERIVSAWRRYGPGMYGMFSSNLVSSHMNTSAFACTPYFLREYPTVVEHHERYEFEHGPLALWRRINRQNFPTKLVTWSGVYDPPQWRQPENILWRGDQSNCLVFCNHTDRYFASPPATKHAWEQGADQPFR